jgi:hypothetical protein
MYQSLSYCLAEACQLILLALTLGCCHVRIRHRLSVVDSGSNKPLVRPCIVVQQYSLRHHRHLPRCTADFGPPRGHKLTRAKLSLGEQNVEVL